MYDWVAIISIRNSLTLARRTACNLLATVWVYLEKLRTQ